jgi:1-acyl-sn-glycerol-3-phosphate acyltransferase
MAKQELFDSRLKRFFLKQLLAFPVYRRHADMLSLKQAMAVLEHGHIFGIFPEGRRSITGELDSFEKGAAFLALRCNAPIVPVYADPDWKKRKQSAWSLVKRWMPTRLPCRTRDAAWTRLRRQSVTGCSY